ncbi:hypothetical protein C8Q76DRAFT_688385 [Earliella scabrosa]|nr:hypothetical protein C8Q76DRAFT_688385 [Earliella scabrosa]
MVTTMYLLSSASLPEPVAMSGASAPCDDDVVVFMHGARRPKSTHTDVATLSRKRERTGMLGCPESSRHDPHAIQIIKSFYETVGENYEETSELGEDIVQTWTMNAATGGVAGDEPIATLGRHSRVEEEISCVGADPSRRRKAKAPAQGNCANENAGTRACTNGRGIVAQDP